VTFAPPTTTTHAPVEHRGHLASQSSPVVHTVPSPNAVRTSFSFFFYFTFFFSRTLASHCERYVIARVWLTKPGLARLFCELFFNCLFFVCELLYVVLIRVQAVYGFVSTLLIKLGSKVICGDAS
jgi:hypothetical protein